MGMEEWIKEQQRRYLDEPRLKELTEVMKQIRKFVREKEYRKLTELVRRYRKSEDVITQVACLLSNSHLFPTPEKTVETDRSELMTALKNTYFMEKNGCWLADVNPEKADSVHGMLAMHTFMRDAYLKVYPESKQERPSPEEVRSSVRILDFHRKESDVWELCNLLCILCRPHGMWHSGTGLRMIMTGLTDCTVPDRNRHMTRGWHWKAACAGMRKRQRKASGMSVCRISTWKS